MFLRCKQIVKGYRTTALTLRLKGFSRCSVAVLTGKVFQMHLALIRLSVTDIMVKLKIITSKY